MLNITFECFTLHQVQIVRLFEDAAFEPATESLQVATINIEYAPLHFRLFYTPFMRIFTNK